METLPLEVVELIAQHLTAEDLASCCAASKSWRDLFNYDYLWKWRCRENLVQYLKNTECIVEPKFVTPETVNTLSPVGEWRLSYMKENHLWNNWRAGNHTEVNLSGEWRRFEIKYCFLTNDLLLWIENTNVSLLDTSVTPVLKLCEPFQLLKASYGAIDSCEMFSENLLVVRQSAALTVYNIGSPLSSVWTLKHVFYFDQKDVVTLEEAEELASHYPSEEMGDPLLFECIIVGDIFIASTLDNKIHIWDLKRGKKLKEEKTYEKSSVRRHFFKKAEEQLNKFIIASLEFDIFVGAIYNYYVYSLDLLDFCPFKKEYINSSGWCPGLPCNTCVLFKNLLAIWNENVLEVYNHITSEQIILVPFVTGIEVFNSDIYFICSNKVKVFNVPSEAVNDLHRFRCNKRVKSLETVCDRFLLVTKLNGSEEVWEVRNKFNKTTQLKFLDSLDYVRDLGFKNVSCYEEPYLNECCTKIILAPPVMKDPITLINFW